LFHSVDGRLDTVLVETKKGVVFRLAAPEENSWDFE
jgi:hypothetical protein